MTTCLTPDAPVARNVTRILIYQLLHQASMRMMVVDEVHHLLAAR